MEQRLQPGTDALTAISGNDPAGVEPVVYALLIGINDYGSPENNLAGCINDIKGVEQWLRSTYPENGKLHLRRMTDEDTDCLPTRPNIIEGFDFFSAAKTNDICLFYYCGHGANLANPPLFEGDEGTKVVQALVCRSADGVNRYITDKELSYLIWTVTCNKPGLRFVAITDCCHSGSITREILKAQPTEFQQRWLRTDDACPPIEQFAGYGKYFGEITPYALMENSTAKVYKCVSAGHLHFAAAEDDETAAELLISGLRHGVFTQALLGCLSKNPMLSYRQVEAYCKPAVRNLFMQCAVTHNQTPRLNIIGLSGEYGDDIFLAGISALKNTRLPVYFDMAVRRWRLDAGALHGISINAAITVRAETRTATVKVTAVYLLFADLEDLPFEGDQCSSQLFGEVAANAQNTVRIALTGQEETDPVITTIFEATANNTAVLVTDPGKADFVLFKKDAGGWYVAANQPKGAAVWLFGAVTLGSPVFLTAAGTLLAKIAAWHRLKLLRNTLPLRGGADFRVNLLVSCGWQNGGYIFEEGEADYNDRLNNVSYTGNTNPAFTFEIQNTGDRLLYISCVYLDNDFNILPGAFDVPSEVDGGQKVIVRYRGSNIIPINNTGIGPIVDYFKIFVSLDCQVELSSLQQVFNPGQNRMIAQLADAGSPGRFIDDGWQTVTAGFRINPKNG